MAETAVLQKGMAQSHHLLAHLTDEQLLAEVVGLAARERQATAELIRSLMELDARRLCLAQGYSSLFTYCTQVLHLSEHAALGRIEVARAARRLPAILDRLLDGSLTVTNVRLLAPHLTEQNHREVLASARHKSKRDVEAIVAKLRPLPDVAASVRKLPDRKVPFETAPALDPRPTLTVAVPNEPAPPAAVAAPALRHRPVVAPLAPERYKVQITVSRETHDRLRRAQDLLRHSIPDGDVAAVFDRALTLLIDHLEKQRFAATSRPRDTPQRPGSSRHIPATVRREVWARDEGRCAFVGAAGRCEEMGFLEFHHVVPFAAGGAAEAANIQLRCRPHNAFESELFFGTGIVRETRAAWG
jgi:5-methylcytosine-specific restriction endonuclease McrA